MITLPGPGLFSHRRTVLRFQPVAGKMSSLGQVCCQTQLLRGEGRFRWKDKWSLQESS